MGDVAADIALAVVEVEVAPGVHLRVLHRAVLAGIRAGKAAARRQIQSDIQALPFGVETHVHHLPGRPRNPRAGAKATLESMAPKDTAGAPTAANYPHGLVLTHTNRIHGFEAPATLTDSVALVGECRGTERT